MSQSAAEHILALTPALQRIKAAEAARAPQDKLWDLILDADREEFYFHLTRNGITRAVWWDHAEGQYIAEREREGHGPHKSRRLFDDRLDAINWVFA